MLSSYNLTGHRLCSQRPNYLYLWMIYHWQRDKLCSLCMIQLLLILLAVSGFSLQDQRLEPSGTVLPPDHTPPYFHLWGHRKGKVCSKSVNTRNELWRSIQAAATTIRHMPQKIQRTGNSWHHSAHLCIQTDKKHSQ